MKRGFTLIELLIVIGILAILATIVILILNPAQILAQARDSQRLSDLGSVKSAIVLYQSTATSTNISATTTATLSSVAGVPCPFTAPSVSLCAGAYSALQAATGTQVTGVPIGQVQPWVPIAFTQTSGGSSIPALPLDPLNIFTYDATNPYYYAYVGDNNAKTFKVEGHLESVKYQPLMTQDGGTQNTCTTSGASAYKDNTCWYETFTGQTL